MYSLLYIQGKENQFEEQLLGSLKPKLKILNQLSHLRSEKKVTQQGLADAIGVTRATINAMERGNYNPSLELAFRLSLYFEKNVEEIFHVEGGYE